MKKAILALVICFAGAQVLAAQIGVPTLIRITRAEDTRRFGPEVGALLKDKDAQVRARAALAAGRIGDDAAVGPLVTLLKDDSSQVAEMAAFALGEIESEKGARAILEVLNDEKAAPGLRARAVEAAGKIAAANSRSAGVKRLGEAILDTLESEDRKGASQSKETVLLGLTAALRAKPKDADYVIAKFFTNKDARIRADAANAYARVRGKAAFKQLQSMLLIDEDPVVRANAARALGVAGDKTAINLLFGAAETDDDLRVRVNALRALGALKEPATAGRMLKRAEKLFETFKRSKAANPTEQNELLEAASSLGEILASSRDQRATGFLEEVFSKTRFETFEVAAALAKIDVERFYKFVLNVAKKQTGPENWRAASACYRGLNAATSELEKPGFADLRKVIYAHLDVDLGVYKKLPKDDQRLLAFPDLVQLFAAVEPTKAVPQLRELLRHPDPFVRTAAASALADMPPDTDTVKALQAAFASALKTDKRYDDAQLALLSAIVKLDKASAKSSIEAALDHYDYLVRRQALRLIQENGLEKEFPKAVERATGLRNYDDGTSSKLGQVLDTDADYRRALTRKNGTVRALVTTGKGKFDIELFPEQAPLTVDNFVGLAEKGYFNGIDIHRVVPNFVVQDGDPRGDGNGGPGWQIRCEINMIPYERGMVGMALSGKDTGGSQWFVTHSPQPHLDGGYTVFGRVGKEGMKVIDNLVRGDRITSIEILRSR